MHPAACAVVAAERAIKRRMALGKGEKDSDEESEGDEEDTTGAKWGKKRSEYYNDEGVDVDVCPHLLRTLHQLLHQLRRIALRRSADCIPLVLFCHAH